MLNFSRLRMLGAMLVGAVVGAVFGAGVGRTFPRETWPWLCGAIGLICGSVAALDIFVPPPTREITSQDSPPRGPFYSGVGFALASSLSLAAVAYTFDSRVVGECRRQESGEVRCFRRTFACFDQVQTEEVFLGVTGATEDVHGDVLLKTDQEHPQLFAGFPVGSVEQITKFVASNEASLKLTGWHAWPFTAGFAAVSGICLWLSLRCFRDGLRHLRSPAT